MGDSGRADDTLLEGSDRAEDDTLFSSAQAYSESGHTVVAVAFSNANMEGNIDWASNVMSQKSYIEENLRKIKKFGSVTYGRPKIRGWFGSVIIKLECTTSLPNDLSEGNHEIVKASARAIASHLKAAGATDSQLEEILIGAIWKKCICMILDAPDALLGQLFDMLLSSDGGLPLTDTLILTHLTPCFAVQGVRNGIVPDGKEESPAVALLDTDGVELLYLMSPLARAGLLEGGVAYRDWQKGVSNCWRSLPKVSPAMRAPLPSSAPMNSEASAVDGTDTLLLSSSGDERYVGKLPFPECESPEKVWPMNSTPYVSICYTGQDAAKDDIARPTHWFLTQIAKVDAFLDDGSGIIWGQSEVEALVHPAYRCTHALVILSPSFRQREFCVKALNTFMHRRRQQKGLCVLLAPWLLTNLDGYHPAVKNLVWIPQQTNMAADHLLETLWPKALESLGLPSMPYLNLREHLLRYIETMLGGPRILPAESVRFAKEHSTLEGPGNRADDTESSAAGADGVSVTGVTFSGVFMDDDKGWQQTNMAADHLLETLWPKALESLGLPSMPYLNLREHLLRYIETMLGGPRILPAESVRFAKEHSTLEGPGNRADDTESSAAGADGVSVTGVTFSGVFMDDDKGWNEAVIRRKDHIETNLRKISQHGTVTYGRTVVEVKRKGLFGRKGVVTRLECEVELPGDLSDKQYALVKRSASAIARLLRDSGATEADLHRMMIGMAWKG